MYSVRVVCVFCEGGVYCEGVSYNIGDSVDLWSGVHDV